MTFDLASWRAERTPDHAALWFAERWLSYADLDARATRLAAWLADNGIRAGDRVGLLAANHVAHFDLLLAAPRLGYVFVPFNVRLSVAELAEQALLVRPALMLVDDGLAQTSASACEAPLQTLDHYEDWLEQAAEARPDPPPLTADATLMLLFTGGTTGRPKAAQVSYRQFERNAAGTAAAWDLRETDAAIQATPCFHAGIHALSTPLLYAGGRVVLCRSFDPATYLADVARHRCTLMFMVPSMYRLLAATPTFADFDATSVRWAISGGAPCALRIAQDFAHRGIRLRQGYGLTEAGVNCFVIDDAQAAAHPDSVGRPMPHLQAVIRRTDGSPCEPGEVGELTFAGDVVSSGYFESKPAWSEVFREGWLWTGDLAECDRDGLHFIRGRRKELYISGGEKVYPAEVEAALARCEGVSECAVLAIPHAHWGETGVAAVVMEPGHVEEAESLRRALRQWIAGYKLPEHILFVDALPRTGAGKVDRMALRRLVEVARSRAQAA